MHKDTLISCFTEGLKVDAKVVVDSLAYNSIPQWDSVAHMIVVALIEEKFDVMLDTDDIIDMSSVAKAVEILSKYDVAFD